MDLERRYGLGEELTLAMEGTPGGPMDCLTIDPSINTPGTVMLIFHRRAQE